MTKKLDIKDRNKIGRPTVVTPDVLQKLEAAFSYDCTDEEACFQADISPSTLYNYQLANPDFLERKQILKARPVLKARKAIIESFENNPDMALKYLERKRKDEFAQAPNFMQQINVGQSVKVEPTLTPEEKKKRLADMLKAFNKEGEYATTNADPDAIIK